MKKLLLSSAGMGLTLSAFAQLPVSTAPQNRKVLLEEFTGIHCVWCPDGHKRANELKAAKPQGSVVIVNIHTGGYATPGSGEPDFRTAEGNAIAAIPGTNITGYPTGSINRHLFTGQSGFAINRGDWSRYADSTLAKSSYVNVALQGTLNVATRLLTVNVEAYYTANSPVPTNKLTVMLLEDEVLGPQTGGVANYPAMVNPDGTYTHNHMLRKTLSPGLTGEVINTTTSGTTVTKQYTYTVPAQFVNNAATLGNLQIIAFMAESDAEVITAAYGPLTLTGFANAKDADLQAATTAESGVCQGKLTPSIKVYNNGSEAITAATFSYNVNGGTNSTYSFSGTIAPATYKNISLPAITFTPTASNTLAVNVTGVNGGADQNAANNTKSVTDILLTTKMASNRRLTMNFTQDRYGTESSWKLYEEGTGTVAAQDGPFADLTANGVLLHSKDVYISESKCYVLEVKDEYGDGINAGYGAGKYELLSGTTVIASSDGNYGKGASTWFKSAATLGLDDLVTSGSLSLAPNPTNLSATLSFSLKNAAKVNVSIYDAVGRLVATVANSTFNAGVNKVAISTANLAPGLYNVKMQTPSGDKALKLSVIK
ncbi:Omp28-related outer membrane protein [Taibaiella chishuiensis]|uniref:Putative secreted protein (Por secretion system target) n=1 Tax=Taibaiella chishuiensis TaxID=1434707 RepID=A0A2P8CSU0_9BACT|nr:Omp28-related outer membrane protein [Taibaiella chishuiensis]PSK88017.1 putative secreted protein (Por secretion system target) [Taibaiella chishuiensis]